MAGAPVLQVPVIMPILHHLHILHIMQSIEIIVQAQIMTQILIDSIQMTETTLRLQTQDLGHILKRFIIITIILEHVTDPPLMVVGDLGALSHTVQPRRVDTTLRVGPRVLLAHLLVGLAVPNVLVLPHITMLFGRMTMSPRLAVLV